tara:strand:+ start:8820 stop:9554 length:735 start_codon:yes stop_codon:yes gene_type:complete
VKTSEYIEDKINKLPKSYVFTYVDFLTEVNKREAVIKHLNRMVQSGKINKLSKGKYYKPQESVFGTLLPEQYQIVKDLLEEEGRKRIGYITGYSIYNTLGFTTQISNSIQIGTQQTRTKFKRGRFNISFITQKNIINNDNIPLLQLLDVIRFIKKIPDTTVDNSCKRLLVLLKDLSLNEQEQIIKLASKYGPGTRALLGALLSTIGSKAEQLLNDLFISLNPITTYEIPVSENIVPTAKKWYIV